MFPFLHHHRLCLFSMDEVFHKFILYGVFVFLCSSPLWRGCCSVPRGSSCGDWRETRISRECPISSLMRSTKDQRKGILLNIKQQTFINCTYENIPVTCTFSVENISTETDWLPYNFIRFCRDQKSGTFRWIYTLQCMVQWLLTRFWISDVLK